MGVLSPTVWVDEPTISLGATGTEFDDWHRKGITRIREDNKGLDVVTNQAFERVAVIPASTADTFLNLEQMCQHV